jgi:hypothetical protein
MELVHSIESVVVRAHLLLLLLAASYTAQTLAWLGYPRPFVDLVDFVCESVLSCVFIFSATSPVLNQPHVYY